MVLLLADPPRNRLAVLSTYFIRPTPHLKHGPARGDSQQGVGTLPRPCCVIQKALDFSQDGFRESVASESFFSPAAIGSNFSALVKFLGLRSTRLPFPFLQAL